MKKIRSYKKLTNEIINAQTPFRTEIIGYVNYGQDIYPMFLFKYVSKTATKTVILTSGHHGDEPFAVHTLMKWVQKFSATDHPELNFYIYPICNPYGYETGSRDNGARQDTNNEKSFYKNSKVQELAILFDAYPVTADLILDVHGDTGKEQVYAYEHKVEGKISLAEPALLEHDAILPYAREKTIYKMKVTNGVVAPPKYDIGIEGYMEHLGVDYTLTLELPGNFDGQKRTAGGVAIINSILKNFRGAIKQQGVI